MKWDAEFVSAQERGEYIVHELGPVVQAQGRQRRRCMWCGWLAESRDGYGFSKATGSAQFVGVCGTEGPFKFEWQVLERTGRPKFSCADLPLEETRGVEPLVPLPPLTVVPLSEDA